MKKLIFFCMCVLCLLASQKGSAYCPECDKIGWSFTDTILLWEGYADGLGYTNKPADILTTDDFTTNHLVDPTYKWELGFRLGLGYTPCNQQWSYKAFWTHIYSKSHGSKYVNSGAPDFQGIFPVWSMSPDTLEGDYVSSARSSWHLHTDLIDFIFQYKYSCFNEQLTLLPFFGIRGAILSQRITADYFGGTFFSGTDANKLHSRYYSGGPRFGLHADYYLTCGFSLYGRGALTPLFGSFHNTHRETYLDATRYHHTSNKNGVVLSTDYAVGLRWEGWVLENWPKVLLSIAWEGQEFFYGNTFDRGHYGFFSKNRALYLQGVSFTGTLDF